MPQASRPPSPAISANDDPPASADRVTLVVRCTLMALLLIGVLSVFGDSLLGLTAAPAPTSSSPAGAATPTPAPAAR